LICCESIINDFAQWHSLLQCSGSGRTNTVDDERPRRRGPYQQRVKLYIPVRPQTKEELFSLASSVNMSVSELGGLVFEWLIEAEADRFAKFVSRCVVKGVVKIHKGRR